MATNMWYKTDSKGTLVPVTDAEGNPEQCIYKTNGAGDIEESCDLTVPSDLAEQTTYTAILQPVNPTDGSVMSDQLIADSFTAVPLSLPHGSVGDEYPAVNIEDSLQDVPEGSEPSKYTAEGLPEGMKIDPQTGVISGTPTQPTDGKTDVVVTRETVVPSFDDDGNPVLDENDQPVTYTQIISVKTPLIVTDTPLADGKVGTAYSQDVKPVGLPEDATEVTITSVEGLPAGLTYADGKVTGTPTAVVEADEQNPNVTVKYTAKIGDKVEEFTDVVPLAVTAADKLNTIYDPAYTETGVKVSENGNSNDPIDGADPELKTVAPGAVDGSEWTFKPGTEDPKKGIVNGAAPSLDTVANRFKEIFPDGAKYTDYVGEGEDGKKVVTNEDLAKITNPVSDVKITYGDDSADNADAPFVLLGVDGKPITDPEGDFDGDGADNDKDKDPFDPSINDAAEYTPEYPTKGDVPGAEVKVPVEEANDKTFPEGTKFAEKTDNPAVTVDPNTGELTVVIPEGATPGTPITGTITVTYPDGSSEDVNYTVNVNEPEAPVVPIADGQTPEYTDTKGEPGVPATSNDPLPEYSTPLKEIAVDDKAGWKFDGEKTEGKITGTAPSNKELADKYDELFPVDAEGKHNVDWETFINNPSIKEVANPIADVTITYEDGSTDEAKAPFILIGKDGNPITDPEGDFDGDGKPNKDEVEDGTNPFISDDAPTIDPVDENDDKITGDAEPGETIEVIIPGKDPIPTEADEDGNWVIDVPEDVVLKPGDKIIAKDKDGNENETVVEAVDGPTINPVNTDSTEISGEGEPGETVDVVIRDKDGNEVKIEDVPVDENGNWKVVVPEGVDLKAGDKVIVTDERGKNAEAEVTQGKSDADKYDPKGQDQTVKQGDTPKAEDSIANKGDLPEGTKYEWKTPIDTKTVGDKEGIVVVTYPDGSTEEVNATVTVRDPELSQIFAPFYLEDYVVRGSEAKSFAPLFDREATDQLEQEAAPEGTEFAVAEVPQGFEAAVDALGRVTLKAPESATVGTDVTVKVRVSYRDSSAELVDAVFTIADNEIAASYDPQYPASEARTGESVEVELMDGDLPDGAEFFLSQSGSELGGWLVSVNRATGKVTVLAPDEGEDLSTTIRVVYADGSSDQVPFAVALKETSWQKDSNQPKYDVTGIFAGESAVSVQKAEMPEKSTFALKKRGDLPAGWDIAVDAATGSVKFTAPDDAVIGETYSVEIQVTYADGSVETEWAFVNVVERQAVKPGQAVTGNLNWDAPEAKFALKSKPEGWDVTIDEVTGEYRITPPANVAGGSEYVTFEVSVPGESPREASVLVDIAEAPKPQPEQDSSTEELSSPLVIAPIVIGVLGAIAGVWAAVNGIDRIIPAPLKRQLRQFGIVFPSNNR